MSQPRRRDRRPPGSERRPHRRRKQSQPPPRDRRRPKKRPRGGSRPATRRSAPLDKSGSGGTPRRRGPKFRVGNLGSPRRRGTRQKGKSGGRHRTPRPTSKSGGRRNVKAGRRRAKPGKTRKKRTALPGPSGGIIRPPSRAERRRQKRKDRRDKTSAVDAVVATAGTGGVVDLSASSSAPAVAPPTDAEAIAGINNRKKKRVRRLATNEKEMDMVAAARDGDLPRVRFLMERGAEVDFNLDGTGTALWWAARNGHYKIAEYLLVHCQAEVDCRGGPISHSTPLWQACSRGDVDMAQLFVEHGAQWRKRSNQGTDCLKIALKRKHPAVVAFLDAQVDPLSQAVSQYANSGDGGSDDSAATPPATGGGSPRQRSSDYSLSSYYSSTAGSGDTSGGRSSGGGASSSSSSSSSSGSSYYSSDASSSAGGASS